MERESRKVENIFTLEKVKSDLTRGRADEAGEAPLGKLKVMNNDESGEGIMDQAPP